MVIQPGNINPKRKKRRSKKRLRRGKEKGKHHCIERKILGQIRFKAPKPGVVKIFPSLPSPVIVDRNLVQHSRTAYTESKGICLLLFLKDPIPEFPSQPQSKNQNNNPYADKNPIGNSLRTIVGKRVTTF